MYKRILLATDGSPLAQLGSEQGIRLAREMGASVVVIYVSPPFASPVAFEFVPFPPASIADYGERADAQAAQFMEVIHAAATRAEVPCEQIHVRGIPPAEAIVTTAKSEKCDLVVVGSHGRTALGQLFLGSVTTRILATCSVPVLVYRQAPPARRARKT